MITLSCEIVCDGCKTVIASVGPDDRMASWLIHEAEALARSHGAQINVVSVTCRECLDNEKMANSTQIHPT